jgi:acetyl-CoA synthetase
MADKQDSFGSHLPEYHRTAYIKGLDEYQRLYRRSIDEPEKFWAEQAERYLTWFKPWNRVLRYDFDEALIEWFGGGALNAAYNCIDRHLAMSSEKIAYLWQGDDPSETRTVTYGELFEQVSRFASVLRQKGVGRGDRVVIYLPMIIELPIAMLACARIGAVHCVVFGEFGPMALANRIIECQAKVLVTADGGYRSGRIIPFKEHADQALGRCPGLETVIVYRRAGLAITLHPRREIWWHEAMARTDPSEKMPAEIMDAEDPLFILFTSGTTGIPKGVVHTHGGYLLFTAMTTRLIFDLKDDEIFWCTADIGWVTGHSYCVYGPLLNGLTSVMYEGSAGYPDFGRFGEIIQKFKVNKFYTTPTLIRALAKEAEERLKDYDLSSLKLLATAGEPISPETWRWFHHHLGRDRCPVIDTYWQTETGGPLLTPLPGAGALKPGSCSFPFFGIDPVILDDVGEEVKYPNQEGVLCIRRPWPGIARTIYGDHDRFLNAYFSQAPGMFFTADGARKDRDGYYWIIGRIDEVINVSSNRLGTAEIEAALMLHPLVAEAAVVGPPHPLKGQGIYAFVTVKTGVMASQKLKDELVRLVRCEIGPIASIDAIQWADAVPKTRSGKIMRHILNQIASGTFDSSGDLSAVSDPDVLKGLIEGRIDYDDAPYAAGV